MKPDAIQRDEEDVYNICPFILSLSSTRRCVARCCRIGRICLNEVEKEERRKRWEGCKRSRRVGE